MARLSDDNDEDYAKCCVVKSLIRIYVLFDGYMDFFFIFIVFDMCMLMGFVALFDREAVEIVDTNLEEMNFGKFREIRIRFDYVCVRCDFGCIIGIIDHIFDAVQR